MSYGTSYTETEALLAFANGDEAEAQRIVNEMFPNERAALEKAASALASLCHPTSWCQRCGGLIAERTDMVTKAELPMRRAWHRRCWDLGHD